MKPIIDMNKLTGLFKKDKGNKMLILFLMGILLLVIVWPVGQGTGSSADQPEAVQTAVKDVDTELDAYIDKMEERLADIVGAIEGAGKVQVMITAKSTKELVVEKDRTNSGSYVDETDSSGGTRHSTDNSSGESTIYAGDGSPGSPYVVKELEPEIEGVVVVAEGGGNSDVANEITSAISVLFNVQIHKIKVVKMNSN